MKQSGAARNNRKTALQMMVAMALGCTACLIPMLFAGGVMGGLAGLLGGLFGWIAGGAVLLAGLGVMVSLRLKPKLAPAPGVPDSANAAGADAGCGC